MLKNFEEYVIASKMIEIAARNEDFKLIEKLYDYLDPNLLRLQFGEDEFDK